MRMAYLNLFGQLVPTFSLADPRADSPGAGLRPPCDPLQKGVDPRCDDVSVDVVAPDVLTDAFEVASDRVAEPPVLAAEPGELCRVHARVVVGDVVLEQE